MDHALFQKQLHQASKSAIDFAKQFVLNPLPDRCRYLVLLNQSYDHHAKPNDLLFPEDDGVVHKYLKGIEVVDLLCREDSVPQWIDISVCSVGENFTLLKLLCCGRYVSDSSRLYYLERRTEPFGIKSPSLPSGWGKKQKFFLPAC